MRTPPHSDPQFHFEIVCPVEPSVLRIIRRFIANIAEEMGFGEDDAHQIEMSVDEACANVVMHAYDEPDSPPSTCETGSIEVKVLMEPTALTIHILDRGKGLTKTRRRPIESLQEYQQPERERYDGLGILIMKQFMDEVNLGHGPEMGTMVTLRKFIKS